MNLLLMLACASAPEPPSILLVTLDTTRADHLSPYGAEHAETPVYSRLADEGVVFERTYTVCPLTIPSHSTILTGLTPPAHGVRDNGDFILSDTVRTLPERLHDAGYHTAAITAAFPTQRRWGFGQGFDVYHDPLQRRPEVLDWRDERQADEVVDDAIGVLDGLEGPTFAWVHLFDAHRPYRAPTRWTERFPDDPYAAEIAFAAEQVQRLLTTWDQRHPRSVVVVVADHGEGLGDGGEITHGFLLYDGTIHVPLIVRAHGLGDVGLPAGTRVSDLVSTVDIAPTLLALAGVDSTGEPPMEGRDLRQGGVEMAWSECLTGQYSQGLAPLYAFTDESGRFTEGAWGAWYPYADGVVQSEPDESADNDALAARLQRFRETLGDATPVQATLDADDFDRLAALGYMGGDPLAKPGTVDPRDVIDLLPLTWRIREAMGRGRMDIAQQMLAKLEEKMSGTAGVDTLKASLMAMSGDLEQAMQLMVSVYLRAPSSTAAMQTGDLWARMDQWDEAESWYAEALRIQPASPNAMAGLVHASLGMGFVELARERVTRFLAVYPDDAELQLVFAELEAEDGDLDSAETEAERALQAMPGNPLAYMVLAKVRWEQGSSDQAITLNQQALALDPFDVSTRMELVRRLLELKRAAEAVRVIAPVAAVFPDIEAITDLQQQARDALDAELGR